MFGIPLGLIQAQAFNGLQQGMLLALISAGLTIIYGALGVLNLAHGALYVVGAYAGYVVYAQTGSFLLALPAAGIAALLVGLLMERVVVRYFYDRPDEDQILVTFGIGIILVEAIRAGFGGSRRARRRRPGARARPILGFLMFPFPWYKIQTMAIAAGLLLAFYLILYRTKLGLVVRAGIEDAGMVSLLGINVYRVFLIVFGLGAMAAGLAGIINSPITAPTPDVGARYLVLSFVVIVIGGVGSFPGAVLGGIVAGEIMTLTSLFNPSYSEVMLFAAMALILLLRPQGFFGRRSGMMRRAFPWPELGLAATLVLAPFVLPFIAADVPMLSRILIWGLFGSASRSCSALPGCSRSARRCFRHRRLRDRLADGPARRGSRSSPARRHTRRDRPWPGDRILHRAAPRIYSR